MHAGVVRTALKRRIAQAGGRRDVSRPTSLVPIRRIANEIDQATPENLKGEPDH